ncbi:MAG: hypothetical protein Q9168_008215 [Polycauliona sp. 1 TL-2023]
MSDLLEQLRSIKTQVAEDGAAHLNASDRREAATLAHSIMLEIEDPGNLVDRIIYQPIENALIRVAVDTGLFDLLNDSSSPLTAQDLSSKLDVEEILLERILRGLAAMHAVDEIGVDGYGPTKITTAFTTVKGTSMARSFGDLLHPPIYNIPQLLRSAGFRNPTDSDNTAFNIAFDTKRNVFDHMAQDPSLVRNFGLFMASQTAGRPNFLDFFPAKEQVLKGYESELNKDGVIFVDIGGAQGSEALEFQRRFPSHAGRLILQERAAVVEQVPATDGLEIQVHDLFSPQPIRGARVYYFRRILHDWNDSWSLKILQQTAKAMAPGYSKMIINDIVMPRRGASPFATKQDMLMMAMFSSVERTEQMWRDLLHEAGLKIVKIWTADGAVESVIEAMLE